MTSTFQAEPYQYTSQDYAQYGQQTYNYDPSQASQYSTPEQYSSYNYSQYAGDASSYAGSYDTSGYSTVTGQYSTGQYDQSTAYSATPTASTLSQEQYTASVVPTTAAGSSDNQYSTTVQSSTPSYDTGGNQYGQYTYSTYSADGSYTPTAGQYGAIQYAVADNSGQPVVATEQYQSGSALESYQSGDQYWMGDGQQYSTNSETYSSQYNQYTPGGEFWPVNTSSGTQSQSQTPTFGSTSYNYSDQGNLSGFSSSTTTGTSNSGRQYSTTDSAGGFSTSNSGDFSMSASGGGYSSSTSGGGYNSSNTRGGYNTSNSSVSNYSSGRGGYASNRGGYNSSGRGSYNRGGSNSTSRGNTYSQSGGYQDSTRPFSQSSGGSNSSSQYGNNQQSSFQKGSSFGQQNDSNSDRSYGQDSFNKNSASFGSARGGRGGFSFSNRGNGRFQSFGDQNRGGGFSGSNRDDNSDRNWKRPQDIYSPAKSGPFDQSLKSGARGRFSSGQGGNSRGGHNSGSFGENKSTWNSSSTRSDTASNENTGFKSLSSGTAGAKSFGNKVIEKRESAPHKGGRVFGSGDREPFNRGSRAKTFSATQVKVAAVKTGNANSSKQEQKGSADTKEEKMETKEDKSATVSKVTPGTPTSNATASASATSKKENAGADGSDSKTAKNPNPDEQKKAEGAAKSGLSSDELEREKEIQKKIRDSVVTVVSSGEPTAEEVRDMLKPPESMEIPKHLQETLKTLTLERHCVLCSLRLNAPLQAAQHYRGKNHLKRVRMFISCDGRYATDKPAASGKDSSAAGAKSDGKSSDSAAAVKPSGDAPSKTAEGTATAADKGKAEEGGESTNELEYCSLCSVSFTSLKQAEQHYNGKNHAKKMRLAAANKSLEEAATKQIVKKNENESFECALCNVVVTSEEQLNTHLRGMKHQAKTRQQQRGDGPGSSFPPRGRGGRGLGRGMRGGRGGFGRGGDERPDEFAPMYFDERGRGRRGGRGMDRGGFGWGGGGFGRRGGRGDHFRFDGPGRFDFGYPDGGFDRPFFDEGFVERFPVSDRPMPPDFENMPDFPVPGFKRRPFEEFGPPPLHGKRPRRGF